eukprot:5355179-Prymnesium_polylepis.1
MPVPTSKRSMTTERPSSSGRPGRSMTSMRMPIDGGSSRDANTSGTLGLGCAGLAADAVADPDAAAPLGKPTCTSVTLTGVTGRSFCVGTCEMATITLKLSSSTHLPNTVCLLSPGVYQLRKLLSLTFMKICEPPEFSLPVFAIEIEPASLRIFAINSSGMVPPAREMVLPSRRFVKHEPSAGPPVPARASAGSLA